MKRWIIAAMALCASTTSAQTVSTKVLSCDRLSALLNSPTIFGVGRPSIVKACPAFEKGVANFLAANLDSLRKMTGEQAIQWMLHGPVVVKDTVVTPPVIVPPKDSTPVVVPPVDTTHVPAGALVNAHPMGALTQPFVTVPKGWAGRSALDTVRGGGRVPENQHGSFRMLCAYAYMAFDDPIVFPGQPGASHLHQFFGNTAVNAFTDSASIATVGNSTCSGGTANRTGYWTPAAVDPNGNVVAPTTATIYYKSSLGIAPATVQPMPTGLRMISGDKAWSNAAKNQEHVWWTCTDNGPAYSATIPDCGDRVELIVIFPSCWDGVHLDSPDHKSHLTYPTFINSPSGGSSTCPKTHPVVLPEVTEEFYWKVPPGVHSSTWHLSSDMDTTKPGGLSAHADWAMGWNPDIMKTLVTRCINASMDCGVNGIGNGTYLNPPPL